MNSKQINLVKQTWNMITPAGDHTAFLFYRNLLTMDPALKRVIGEDMTVRKKQWVSDLSFVIARLDTYAKMRTRKKLDKDIHYHTVGAALFLAMEQGLGESWNNDVKHAWVEAYSVLSRVINTGGMQLVNKV